MSEPVLPLGGASFDGLVRIREAGPQGMITLRGDLSSTALKAAATGIAAVDFPAQRQANCVGERGLLWMSPDELLVLCPHAQADAAVAQMTATLGEAHALVVNVSDARAVFRLEGTDVREVLAKLAPVDLAPDRLAPGELRRTRLAQVAAAFWLREEGVAEVICFRSVARYVFDLLSVAAAPGSRVGCFAHGQGRP